MVNASGVPLVVKYNERGKAVGLKQATEIEVESVATSSITVSSILPVEGSIIVSGLYLSSLPDVDAASLVEGQTLTLIEGVWSSTPYSVSSLYDTASSDYFAPTPGQALAWNGDTWIPSSIEGGAGVSQLSSLTDADTSIIADQDFLKWDTSTLTWKPGLVVFSSLADVTTTGLNRGSRLVYVSSTYSIVPSGYAGVGDAIDGVYYSWDAQNQYETIQFTMSGSPVIQGGMTEYFYVTKDCIVVEWTLLATSSGDLSATIGNCAYADFPTFTEISGTDKPNLASAQKNQSTDLTGWTIELLSGSILRLTVDADATSIDQAYLFIKVMLV